ncbi:hypothetical protein ACROYT_G015641 [Oculina patagonica]
MINPTFPFLGCSPDAKVIDVTEDNPCGILEIKCPYKHGNVAPETACAGDGQFHLEIKDDFLILKENHIYYLPWAWFRRRKDFGSLLLVPPCYLLPRLLPPAEALNEKSKVQGLRTYVWKEEGSSNQMATIQHHKDLRNGCQEKGLGCGLKGTDLVLIYFCDQIQMSDLQRNLKTAHGLEIKDTMRFFHGDSPSREFESGQQKGGRYYCSGCGAHADRVHKLDYCFPCEPVSLEDHENIAMKRPTGKRNSSSEAKAI